jgi:hypothetical protein
VNSTITPEQLEMLLPLACEWATAQEQRILATGEALSATMLTDARIVGVANPERVRLLYVPEVPSPTIRHYALLLRKRNFSRRSLAV